jgi:hypothetical protein
VSAVDTSNIAFWNELCGTTDAKRLGITDNSAPNLKKFDDWYFAFYPYLLDHIHCLVKGSSRSGSVMVALPRN